MLKITDENFKPLPGIYIIRNILTGKEYIGETMNIRRRMLIHSNPKSKQRIHRSILKHGIDNFQVYCEYLPFYNKNMLLDLETSMIELYNTLIPNGYNVSIGEWYKLCDHVRKSPKSESHGLNVSKAKLGIPLSDRHKSSLSKSHRGKKLSNIHKENIKKAMFKYKNISFTDDRKMKLRNSRKDKIRVLQYTKDGEFLNEFESIRDAERATGVYNSKISDVCKHKRNSAGNFKWEYKN